MIKLRKGVNKISLVEVCNNNGVSVDIIADDNGDILNVNENINGYEISQEGENIVLKKDGKVNSIKDMENLIDLLKCDILNLERMVGIANYIQDRI